VVGFAEVSPEVSSLSCLADYLQHLRHIDVDALTVPPLLLTVVTPEEHDLDPVREHMLYLEHVTL